MQDEAVCKGPSPIVVPALSSGTAQGTLPRTALLAAAVLTIAAGGCGGSPPSTESVVRAWSQALNTDDNERAADLFAHDAEIVQGGTVTTLQTHEQAVAWNSSLPCSGRIVSISTKGQNATATFVLGDRQHSQCDGPGHHATAIFKVVKGKIVLWHQTESTAPPASTA
jgi:limonene-1,2-epoxide hydrolase